MEKYAQISGKRECGDLEWEDMQDYFSSEKIGFWKLKLEPGKETRMYVDTNMRVLIGLPDDLSPEENYSFFQEHIHADDRYLLTEYKKDMEKGEAVVEYRYCHPLEGELQIRCSGRKVVSEKTCTIVMGYDQNVSDVIHVGQSRKRASRLLSQNRDLERKQIRTDDYYKNLMDIVTCGVISYTAEEHRLLHMNAEALRICGVKDLAEAQGHMYEIWRNVVYSDPDVPARLRKIRMGEGAVDYECTIINSAGESVNVLAKSEAFFSPQGERCVVTTILDISESIVLKNEKKVLDDAIREEEQHKIQLENALAASNRKNDVIGAVCGLYWQVLSVDLKKDEYKEIFTGGQFTLDNPKYMGIAHETFTQAVNKYVDSKYVPKLTKFLNTETLSDRLSDSKTIAMEYQDKFGVWMTARYVVQTRDADGKVTSVLFLLQRIDEQKQKELEYQKELERAVEEARRANEAKTNFLRRMSHDIRTPLNGIIGLLQIDESHFDDKDLVRENHRKMEISANYLLSLINDVLQTSKLEDGKVQLTHEVIDLADLTQNIVTIIIGRATEAGLQWDYERGKTQMPYPYIYGSPVHLRQIFLNIYGNCIKYNKPGGKITTVVDTLQEHDGIGTYRWTISDTGIGMSQEFLKHIFDPFAQENMDARSTYQGIGLGMFIVKSLIDQMGGTISVTSQEGGGSTFVITIPFEIAQAPKERQEQEKISEDAIRGMHLMLAEDNELNAEIAKMLLMDKGAEITVVTDGQQAVELFVSSQPGRFDCILMDVMMPVMDGLTATRTIRAQDRTDAKTIPIIAMTANAFEEDAKKCLEAGMNAHLAKPMEIEKVAAVLVKYCR